LWYGVFDLQTKQLRYSGAGHPPAVVRNPAGENLPLISGPFPTIAPFSDSPSPDLCFAGSMVHSLIAKSGEPPIQRIAEFWIWR
jgi:hypothetical protein